MYPKDGGKLRAEIDLDTYDEPFEGVLVLKSSVLLHDYEQKISVMTSNSRKTILAEDLLISSSAANWDEYDGKLYELTAALYKNDLQSSESEINQKEDEKTVSFGIRTFGDDGHGHLSLNGRRIFLRSEANCAEFPETGYIPMEKEAWKNILQTYKDYGINMVRFHSHCPPEAAFFAADEMGILMQPELSHWDPKHAFEFDESFSYYK